MASQYDIPWHMLKGLDPANSDICTLKGSVTTGMEPSARDEISAKLRSVAYCARGRVFFDVKAEQVPEALKLRSLDHIHVLVVVEPKFGFVKNKVLCLRRLRLLPRQLDWRKALAVWQRLSGFQGEPHTRRPDDQLEAIELPVPTAGGDGPAPASGLGDPLRDMLHSLRPPVKGTCPGEPAAGQEQSVEPGQSAESGKSVSGEEAIDATETARGSPAASGVAGVETDAVTTEAATDPAGCEPPRLAAETRPEETTAVPYRSAGEGKEVREAQAGEKETDKIQPEEESKVQVESKEDDKTQAEGKDRAQAEGDYKAQSKGKGKAQAESEEDDKAQAEGKDRALAQGKGMAQVRVEDKTQSEGEGKAQAESEEDDKAQAEGEDKVEDGVEDRTQSEGEGKAQAESEEDDKAQAEGKDRTQAQGKGMEQARVEDKTQSEGEGKAQAEGKEDGKAQAEGEGKAQAESKESKEDEEAQTEGKDSAQAEGEGKAQAESKEDEKAQAEGKDKAQAELEKAEKTQAERREAENIEDDEVQIQRKEADKAQAEEEPVRDQETSFEQTSTQPGENRAEETQAGQTRADETRVRPQTELATELTEEQPAGAGPEEAGDASTGSTVPAGHSAVLRAALPTTAVSDVVSFRATCFRAGGGKQGHAFSSNEGAENFGGAVQELFNWKVQMKGYDLEVILDVAFDMVSVGLSLTPRALFYRNLVKMGPTSLRSTVCYNLLMMAKPQPYEVVIDPMCGGGSISLEGAQAFPGTFHLCGDNYTDAAARVVLNREYSARQVSPSAHLALDVFTWDCTRLPLRDACADVIVSDLPFGKRMGSKFDNRTLYPACMEEMARICTPRYGRAVLLTQDKRTMEKTLHLGRIKSLWRCRASPYINVGGLDGCAYFLQRTDYVRRPRPPPPRSYPVTVTQRNRPPSKGVSEAERPAIPASDTRQVAASDVPSTGAGEFRAYQAAGDGPPEPAAGLGAALAEGTAAEGSPSTGKSPDQTRLETSAPGAATAETPVKTAGEPAELVSEAATDGASSTKATSEMSPETNAPEATVDLVSAAEASAADAESSGVALLDEAVPEQAASSDKVLGMTSSDVKGPKEEGLPDAEGIKRAVPDAKGPEVGYPDVKGPGEEESTRVEDPEEASSKAKCSEVSSSAGTSAE